MALKQLAEWPRTIYQFDYDFIAMCIELAFDYLFISWWLMSYEIFFSVAHYIIIIIIILIVDIISQAA